MNILNPIINDIAVYTEKKKRAGMLREFEVSETICWPAAGVRDIILKPDLALELGNPEGASVSFISWTGDHHLVNDGRISLVGPDIPEAAGKNLPFGKIVILGVEGFDEKNAYDRNRELHLCKFDLSLKGYMIRAASIYMAEWCRISKEALRDQFSLRLLGSALIREYKKLDYVKSVEVIFVTSSNDDVNELFELGNRSARIISAMSKMVNEMSYDCSECEYQDLCEEAEELRKLRTELANNQG